MIIKNILLTGSSGFIGSITKKYLKQKNYNVINLSIRTHESDREFLNYIPVTGVILTKMDGTARGGIATQIMKELNLPVYFIGVGEQVEDLIPFDRESYIKGLIITEKESIVE